MFTGGRLLGTTLASDWAPRLCLVLTQLLLAVYVGASGYASLAIAAATVTAVWSVADMGLGTYALREAAGDSDLVRPIYGFYIVAALTAWLIYSSVCVAVVESDFTLFVQLASALYLPMYALYPDWFLRGSTQFATLAKANWLATIVTGLPLLGAPLMTTPDVRIQACAVSFGLAPGIAAIYCYAAARTRLQPSFYLRPLPAVILGSLPIGLAGASMSAVAPLSLHALNSSTSASSVGLFALGLRIAAAAAGASWALGQNGLRLLLQRQSRVYELIDTHRRRIWTVAGIWLLVTASAVTFAAQAELYFALGLLTAAIYLPKYTGELVLVAARTDLWRLLVGVADLAVFLLLLWALSWRQDGPALALLGAEAMCVVFILTVVSRQPARSSRLSLHAQPDA